MALRRVWFRDVLLNERTRDMILAAEKLVNFRLVLTQGSYNAGGVAASAGTHDGGGAVDIRARDLTPEQRKQLVLACRKVGFAAWLRTPSQGNWPYHVHAIAAGDTELSAGAAAQVKAYRSGRNGLANNGPDDGPDGYRLMTFEYYNQLLAQSAKENEMTPEQEALLAAVDTRSKWNQAQIVEGGSVDKRIDYLTTENAALKDALAALKKQVDALPKA